MEIWAIADSRLACLERRALLGLDGIISVRAEQCSALRWSMKLSGVVADKLAILMTIR
jgi:hypothetical protein